MFYCFYDNVSNMDHMLVINRGLKRANSLNGFTISSNDCKNVLLDSRSFSEYNKVFIQKYFFNADQLIFANMC